MGKKVKDVHVRLDEEQNETLERVARVMGYEKRSDAVRNVLRLVNVLFDERLTLEVAIEPFFLKMLLNDGECRKNVPLIHMIKKIPELERGLGIVEARKMRVRKKRGS